MCGLEPSGQRDYFNKKILRKCEERWENIVCFEEKKLVLVAFYSVCAIAWIPWIFWIDDHDNLPFPPSPPLPPPFPYHS